MTQLNLSGKQLNEKQQKPVTEDQEESIKNQTVGALGALAMFAAVIVIGSCSRSSTPVATQHPAQTPAPVSSSAAASPVPAVPPPAPVAAKTRSRRAATLSYVNREYGVSFRFPKTYDLKTATRAGGGDETQMAAAPTELMETNFVQGGGVALASVEMPANLYPGTDLKSAFINLSVNPGMTSEACAQFVLAQPVAGAEAAPPVRVEQTRIGGIDFDEVEDSDRAMMKQTDAKYYHVFRNGACYEFALGIVTAEDPDGKIKEITPQDRHSLFARLKNILATVRFQPAVLPDGQLSKDQISTQPTEAEPAEHELPKSQAPARPTEAAPSADSSNKPDKAGPVADKPNF